MKILIWIYEDDIDKLYKGEKVDYFEREPGTYEKAIQVIIDLDTYQQLKDRNENE